MAIVPAVILPPERSPKVPEPISICGMNVLSNGALTQEPDTNLHAPTNAPAVYWYHSAPSGFPVASVGVGMDADVVTRPSAVRACVIAAFAAV